MRGHKVYLDTTGPEAQLLSNLTAPFSRPKNSSKTCHYKRSPVLVKYKSTQDTMEGEEGGEGPAGATIYLCSSVQG